MSDFCESSGSLMEDTKMISICSNDSATEVPDKNNLQNVHLDCSSMLNCSSTFTIPENTLCPGLHKNTHELKVSQFQNGCEEIDSKSKDTDLLITIVTQDFSKNGGHNSNLNCVNTKCDNEVIGMEGCGHFSDIQTALKRDVKLRYGCFIKLVDCQVFLKSVMMPPEIITKPKKRKLSDGATSRKCKLKKNGNVKQEFQESISYKSRSALNTGFTSKLSNHQDVCDIINTNLNISEGRNHFKTFSSNDSNIFTNMTSFLLSGTCYEKQEPSFPECGPNEPGNVLKGCQPVVKLFRLPLEKDDESQKLSEMSQENCPKSEDFSKCPSKENSKEQALHEEITKDEELISSDTSKNDKRTRAREKKSTKFAGESRSDKKMSKFLKKGHDSKDSHEPSKKVKADEAMKKIQDAIGIKPIVSQGFSFVKRIPKINQNSVNNARSRSMLDLERKNPLEWGTDPSQNVQNQLEDAGWTRHNRYPKTDKSAGAIASSSNRNFIGDQREFSRYKPDFAPSKRSPLTSDRPFKEAMRPFKSYRNGNYSRSSVMLTGKNIDFRGREESNRNSGSLQRPAPLSSPQNFNNISSDVQFLLKACNVIVESNSNLSSEHQQQFNLACDRLREELEKLVNSANSTPFNSPGPKNSSLKDLGADELMNLLKPHLPQDVYERFCKDISRPGGLSHLVERLHPISPQSSASSASYKDAILASCRSPKHFISNSKICTDGRRHNHVKGEESKISKLLSEEEKLLRTIEKEIKIIETLIRVQDQLSMPEFDKLDERGPDSPPLPHKDRNESRNPRSQDKPAPNPSETYKYSSNHITDSGSIPLQPTIQPTEQHEPNNNEPKDVNPNHFSEDKDKSKKLLEKIISFSRNALKSYYHKGSITSEEFKYIMKKAIAKISESKCKDVSQPKVSRFIDSLVTNVLIKRKKNK